MLEELNVHQREAATHPLTPLLVVAGPGTGKSRLLAGRVWHLVVEQQLAARGIYVITFTRKARANMQSRLEECLPDDQAQYVNVQTIDALAYRILQVESRLKGTSASRSPTVASEAVANSFFREAIEECGWRHPQYSPVQAWQTLRDWKLGPRDPALLPDGLAAVVDRYQSLLVEARKWDLADLLPLASEVLAANQDIASAFYMQALLIDEFQDTTLAQYEFIQQVLVAGGGQRESITAVGAEAQSIYGWRNANYLALRARLYADYPDLCRMKLHINYRSRAHVSQAAAAMAPTYEEVFLDCLQDGGAVYLHESQTGAQEASLIAQLIKQLRAGGLPLSEMAVLVRTWKQSTAIEKALLKEGQPYLLASEGKLPYYKRPVVLALIGYLRAVAALRAQHQPASRYDLGGALGLILNMPPRRGIGPVSREMILDGQPDLGWSQLIGAMVREDLRPQVRASCQELFDLLTGLAGDASLTRPEALIEAVIARTAWHQVLADELDGQEQRRDMRALIGEALLFPSLEAFVDSLADKLDRDWNNDGVSVSTVHAAKGLEWKVVFVAGFNDKILPHASAMKSAQRMSEEERIAHVAFSRARELLFISYVSQLRDERSGELQPMQISRFARRLEHVPRRQFDHARFGLDHRAGPAGHPARDAPAHVDLL